MRGGWSKVGYSLRYEMVFHIKEEHKFVVFENRVLRRVFGRKRGRVTDEGKR